MLEPRLDAWRRTVTPLDSTWDTRPAEVVFCDLCAVAHPANPDIEAVTGLWVCQACIEHTLEGACSEQARI